MLQRSESFSDIKEVDLSILKLDAALRLSKAAVEKLNLFDVAGSDFVGVCEGILVEYDVEKEITLKEVRALKRLRPNGFILYLSRSDEVSELVGLRAGALDVLHGGMSITVISERIAAAMRRRVGDASKKYISLAINVGKHYLILNDRKLKMTLSEIKIIEALASDPGGIVSRDALLSILRDFSGGANSRSIDSHIKRLRLKLLSVCSDCKIIESVYRGGYRLSASVAVVWEPLNVQSRSLYSELTVRKSGLEG